MNIDITDETLAALLKNWIETNKSKSNPFSNNIVGLTLKTELTKLGHWKMKARGNPNKGQRAYQINKQKKLISGEQPDEL